VVDAVATSVTTLATTARPTKATISKPNPSIATGVGVEPGTLRQSYSLTFDMVPTGLEPAAE
jgi:hypothetical protein